MWWSLAAGIQCGLLEGRGVDYFWRELYYFHKYVGVSNAFALHTATGKAAKVAGSGYYGNAGKGQVCGYDCDCQKSLEDIRALGQVEMVVARGNRIENPKVKVRKQVKAELDKFLV